MSKTPTNQVRPAHARPMTDEELEAQAIAELERMERARNAKRSSYKPKRRGQYENSRR